jgi:tryptophan 2,3-dioxygenase
MKNTPNYRDYLKLNSLLKSQELVSDKMGKNAHDEMLFIITHQVYELWFKQILYEIDSIFEVFKLKMVDESKIGTVVSRLHRINEIIQLLIDQIKILETMTPMDFLEFRDLLTPASGFQSGQFRMIENKIGLLKNERHAYGGKDYKDKIHKNEFKDVESSENSESLFVFVEKWLERTPFLISEDYNFWDQYKKAVKKMILNDKKIIEKNENLSDDERESYYSQYNSTEKMFNSFFDESVFLKMTNSGQFRLSYKATHAALLILLYRDQPILHNPYRFLSKLIDLDELLTTWRYRHHLLATRMIGKKIGTGGSVGASYLKKALTKHRVFEDLSSLTTFLIPRSELPSLPENIIRKLSFHYDSNIKK